MPVFLSEGRAVHGGLDIGTGMTLPAWTEVGTAMKDARTSAKLVTMPKLSDIAYREFTGFMAHHKFDVTRDIDGVTMIAMSVRVR